MATVKDEDGEIMETRLAYLEIGGDDMPRQYNSPMRMAEQVDVIAAKHEVTPAGVKLLQVLSNPINRTLTMVRQCELAEISQDTYYRLAKDVRWQSAYYELCRTTFMMAALPASQALAEMAAAGDPSCIKMALELSGLYQNSATINVHQDNKPSLKDILKSKAHK